MKTAIAILNWNGKELLEEFLPAIIRYSSSADIYVIDNASTDNSIAFLTQNFPSIKQVILKENYGFARGYNEGLKHIDADLYCLLNNDVEVTENWLNSIVEGFKKTNVSIAQPLLLHHKNKKYFDYAGAAGGFIDKYGFAYCRGRIFNDLEENLNQYNNTYDCFWASGACFFVRKNVWNELGGFDEDFFMHQEEIDFCWRAFNAGKIIQTIGTSFVYHVGGASLAPSPKKTYYNHRNALWMMLKNLPKASLFPILLQRFILDGIAGIHYLFQGNFISFFMVIKAHLAVYASLRKTIKKRPNISAKRQYFQHKSIVWDYFILRKSKFHDL